MLLPLTHSCPHLPNIFFAAFNAFDRVSGVPVNVATEAPFSLSFPISLSSLSCHLMRFSFFFAFDTNLRHSDLHSFMFLSFFFRGVALAQRLDAAASCQCLFLASMGLALCGFVPASENFSVVNVLFVA